MRSFRTLILSLAVHIVLALLLWKLPKPDLRPRETVQWMDTSQLTPQQKAADKKLFDDQKAFVRKAAPPKDLLTNKERPTRFSSEDKQYVLQETRAHENGLTENRSHQAMKPVPAAPSESQSQAAKSTETKNEKRASRKTQAKADAKLNLNPRSPLEGAVQHELKAERQAMMGKSLSDVQVGGLSPRGESPEHHLSQQERNRSVPLELPNFAGIQPGESTVGETLPDDIKFGEFTALNTDRNLFYSFYSRMEEVIRPPWVSHARAALYSYETGARKLTGHETWQTKIEILLDKNGNYVRAIVHEGSGIPALDEAPVEAFRGARQFPHPPPEMVKGDGYIHIYCMFTVAVSPQYAGRGE